MTSLEFYCHDIVEQRPATGTFLFNRPQHLLLQSQKGWKVYGMRDIHTKKIAAQIFINSNEGFAVSPFRAPFGSLEAYENITEKDITELFKSIEKELKAQDVFHFKITHYPEAYDQTVTRLLQKTLAQLNFTSRTEVSSVISVDELPFEKKIKIGQWQRLRKSEKQFEFHRVKNSKLKSVYSFLKNCRKRKGQSLSMSFDQLHETVRTFPDDFLLFEVVKAKQIVAAAVVIRVSERILYTFYYAHDRDFDKVSPTVFLISGIYQYAQEYKFLQLDLGTSMVNGHVNTLLIQFKKRIGGLPSSKFIFEKQFS